MAAQQQRPSARPQGAQGGQPQGTQEAPQRAQLIPGYNPYGGPKPSPNILDSIIEIFETDYPPEVCAKLPFSTSEKPALSSLPKGEDMRYLDSIGLVLFLQSFPPEDVTPDLILLTEELKKEALYNSSSAQGGTVLRLATGSFHVVEQSQTHKFVEEDSGGWGPFGLLHKRKRS